MTRLLLLLCVAMIAAPLRAEPPPPGMDPVVLKVEDTPPSEQAPPRSGPCIAGPFIVVRTAQPHVDALKTQVKQFLAIISGSPATMNGAESVFVLKQPMYGIKSLVFMPDAKAPPGETPEVEHL